MIAVGRCFLLLISYLTHTVVGWHTVGWLASCSRDGLHVWCVVLLKWYVAFMWVVICAVFVSMMWCFCVNDVVFCVSDVLFCDSMFICVMCCFCMSDALFLCEWCAAFVWVVCCFCVNDVLLLCYCCSAFVWVMCCLLNEQDSDFLLAATGSDLRKARSIKFVSSDSMQWAHGFQQWNFVHRLSLSVRF